MSTDISELMSRDPLGHSDQDIDLIIGKLREMRAQYNLGAAMAGSTKPKTAKAKQAESLLSTESKLDITDILGEL